jgi:hypothetical protein
MAKIDDPNAPYKLYDGDKLIRPVETGASSLSP